MKLASRIRKLERELGRNACGVCGLAGGAELPVRVEYVIDEPPPPPRESDTCAACGRDTVRVIRVVFD